MKPGTETALITTHIKQVLGELPLKKSFEGYAKRHVTNLGTISKYEEALDMYKERKQEFNVLHDESVKYYKSIYGDSSI